MRIIFLYFFKNGFREEYEVSRFNISLKGVSLFLVALENIMTLKSSEIIERSSFISFEGTSSL